MLIKAILLELWCKGTDIFAYMIAFLCIVYANSYLF